MVLHKANELKGILKHYARHKRLKAATLKNLLCRGKKKALGSCSTHCNNSVKRTERQDHSNEFNCN